MGIINTIKEAWLNWLEHGRIQLARPDASMHLALVGLITGFLAGSVIVIFRLLVEDTQDLLLPGTGAENYEELSVAGRFFLPTIGGILLALLFYFYAANQRVLGIAKVIDRLTYHQGYFSLRGFLLQFFGAAIAIICGHSVGREGPHVYLGASISSLFAQAASLPNNSIRTMVACGAAAGVSASFNTPLAGVIFALEVVMMEFSLASFIPIILASVVATSLSNAVFGIQPAFEVPTMSLTSLTQLPIIMVLGISIGVVSALFNHMIENVSRLSQPINIWWKLCAAGVIAGACGVIQPEVMGIGYDSITFILNNPQSFTIFGLVMLVCFKLIATSFCVGLGVPAGMIGPAFIIGAAVGAIAGILVSFTDGWSVNDIGFYALLGMGAMMAASLQAPLAALTAIIELTYNPGIVMPGMLTIVIAQLTARVVFKKDSLFITMLRSNDQDYQVNPISLTLRRIGVASLLEKNFIHSARTVTRQQAEEMVKMNVKWIIISNNGVPSRLIPMVDLARYVKLSTEGLEEIDLIEIPAQRLQLDPISLQSNLLEAHIKFKNGAESLCVVFKEDKINQHSRIYGILLPDMVTAAYRV
ncbi:MAG: chloride channel protein [Proteobacteria bacterium]|nr:MAG: chloride channel protein [Pseudomonadota bacterium]